VNPATWVLIIGAAAFIISIGIVKQFSVDRFDALAERLRGSSRVVSRCKFIDGDRRRDVLLALTDSTFIYQSSEGQSSFERQWIREVEYENELSTGKSVGADTVLRLRCFSRTFEFVLSPQVFREWQILLPASAKAIA
jgi:hypothetical protein